ncbi:MAG: DUF1848 domain-containing protein [Firmicutes bacterium]|nr:DUF1848 domain-containing protein [Bacillota bacterium]
MILSVSRRTDIPALYSEWFFERLRAGYFLVPSPFILNKKIARVNVSPVRIERNLLGAIDTNAKGEQAISDNIDGIMFWSKNPEPMIKRLSELESLGYSKYCFLFTLNPYGAEIEQNVPPLKERIDTFKELSSAVGADRVFWRYDPILLTSEYDASWHMNQFEMLATQLNGYTKNCKFSFILGKHPKLLAPTCSQKMQLAKAFADISKANGILLETCAVEEEFSDLGISQSKCIDPEFWEEYLNAKRKSNKLDGQRKNCLCMPSVDIGIYNTCKLGCIYCYANGFYANRGKPTCQTKTPRGAQLENIYERKIERSFNYS